MSESPSTPIPRTQAHQRPLSPHLSVYRMPLTAGMMSITHRASGIFLSIGMVFFVAWLWTAAYCPNSYPLIATYGQEWWAKGLLALWSLAFFYHFLNGIRHLFWDMGQGLELDAAQRSGYLCLSGSLVITAFIWYMLLV